MSELLHNLKKQKNKKHYFVINASFIKNQKNFRNF